jgi:hypothetical protein
MYRILISSLLLLCSCTEDSEPVEVEEVLPGSILVSPESIDFGEMELLTEQTSYLNIENQGEGTLQIFDVILADDAQRPHWSLEGGLSGFMEPGQQIGFILTARPQSLDNPSTGLLIRSDDPEQQEVSIPLSISVYALPELRLEPPKVLELGTVPVGDTSIADVVIANDGYAVLYVNQVSLSETSPFSVDIDATGTSVPSRTEDGLVRIQFSPEEIGSFTQTLTIETSDTAAGAWTLVVQGTGS